MCLRICDCLENLVYVGRYYTIDSRVSVGRNRVDCDGRHIVATQADSEVEEDCAGEGKGRIG